MYSVRTRLNVDKSDGTLILYTNELGNGSVLTAEYAMQTKKPLLLINIVKTEDTSAILNWLEKNEIKILNIAGPRESTSPGVYFKTLRFLKNTFL